MSTRSPTKMPGHPRSGRPKNRYPAPDPIDALDTTPFGGAYHHPGPFDPALAARNLNPKYAPLAAVHDSNMKALEATPREFVVDSLEKHVPLQGTAVVPPGRPGFAGEIMMYEDGADLMREPDAEGGPYRRWEGLTYHPDDLKGKGEPSYTIEENHKASRRAQRHRGLSLGSPRRPGDSDLSAGDAPAYEMHRRPEPYSDFAASARPPPRGKPLRGGGDVAVEELRGSRQRSVSDVPRYTGPTGLGGDDGEGGVTRGGQFGSIRRRFGSLRRKAAG